MLCALLVPKDELKPTMSVLPFSDDTISKPLVDYLDHPLLPIPGIGFVGRTAPSQLTMGLQICNKW